MVLLFFISLFTAIAKQKDTERCFVAIVVSVLLPLKLAAVGLLYRGRLLMCLGHGDREYTGTIPTLYSLVAKP